MTQSETQAATPDAAELAFLDATRFQFEGRLGAGGMGVVYRVFDRHRGKAVALKTIGSVNPDAFYALKKEFRALQSLRHPGLITLNELFATGVRAYFTMELVAGAPFTRLHRVEWRTSSPAPGLEDYEPTRNGSGDGVPSRVATKSFDELRRCLTKLAQALDTLHQAGKVHRDIKPSNVLVTPEGRVVLLDFGLSQDLHPQDPGLSYQEQLVAGTPAYMAPEQVGGSPASPASDWYAVGVMLYETLSGRLPFMGTVREVFSAKQSTVAPSLREEAACVPPDLAGLCKRLLDRSPSNRPTASQVLGALGAELPTASVSPVRPPRFVGRAPHLELLERAFGKALMGVPALVTIRGPVGAGKTALVGHFCDNHVALDDAVVLWSRCHPRETIPFRALDAAVDDLSRQLRQTTLPSLGVPRHAGPLVRLFPALARVASLNQATAARTRAGSPALERRLAFDAFSEVLSRLADRRPLLLVVDDAEFGDRDSAELLIWFLSQPAPPGLLVLCCYAEDRPLSGFVSSLQRARLGGADRVELELFELPVDEANELAVSLLDEVGNHGASFRSLAASLALEAGGLPGALVELVADGTPVSRRDGSSPASPYPGGWSVWVERSLQLKLGSLSSGEETVLRILALSFSPISLEAITLAVSATQEECKDSIHALLASRLANLYASREEDLFHVGRENIRHTVTTNLSEKKRSQTHALIAKSLLSCGDNANAGRHYRACGMNQEAAACFTEATRQALGSMALESALGFIEEALSCGGDGAMRARLYELQANCHEGLGHPGHAAESLMSAAALSSGGDADAFLRRALVQQAHAGEFEALSAQNAKERRLFDSLPRSSIESIVAQCRIVHGEPGDCLVDSDDDASDFLFILSGMVELRQPSTEVAEGPLLGQVGTGELVGEISFLLEEKRRVEVVVAAPATRVLCVSRASLDELALQEPRVALRVVLNLAQIVCGKLVGLRERILRYGTVP